MQSTAGRNAPLFPHRLEFGHGDGPSFDPLRPGVAHDPAFQYRSNVADRRDEVQLG